MEASPFEKNLSGSTVRASAYVSELPSKEESLEILQFISPTYPNLNERYEEGKIYSDSIPIITETEINTEDEKESECLFMTKVMSTIFSLNNAELFLIKKKTNNIPNGGAVLLSLSHSLCDGALISQILGDFISIFKLKKSNKSIECYKRAKTDHVSQLEIAKDLKSCLQSPEEIEKERKYDLIVIPPPLKEFSDPNSGKLFYKGICLNFDINKIIEVCHSIKVRPQAYFTTSEIFSLCGAINEITANDPNKPFSIISQISVNTRKLLKISLAMPTCYAAPVYIISNIDSEVNGKFLMCHIQNEIDQKVEKYAVSHLKAYCEGKFPPVSNQSWTSNVGIVESEVPLFVQGGAYSVPEAARANRGFTSHLITTKSKIDKNAFPSQKSGAIVLTFLHPSCDEKFINEMVKRFEWFLNNPSKALDVKILGGVIPK